MRVLRSREGTVTAVAFSPDGAKLASGDEFGIIKIWNVADGTVSREWRAHIFDPYRDRAVGGILFSPEGDLLVSAGADGIKVWDTKNWSLVRQFRQYATTASLAFSADGKVLAIGGFETILIQVSDWKELRRLRNSSRVLALSPDGQFLALGSEDGIAIRRVTNGEATIILKDYGYVAIFSLDGRTLITASLDRISFWDIATGKLLRTLT